METGRTQFSYSGQYEKSCPLLCSIPQIPYQSRVVIDDPGVAARDNSSPSGEGSRCSRPIRGNLSRRRPKTPVPALGRTQPDKRAVWLKTIRKSGLTCHASGLASTCNLARPKVGPTRRHGPGMRPSGGLTIRNSWEWLWEKGIKRNVKRRVN